jgi:hypothetical protein
MMAGGDSNAWGGLAKQLWDKHDSSGLPGRMR